MSLINRMIFRLLLIVFVLVLIGCPRSNPPSAWPPAPAIHGEIIGGMWCLSIDEAKQLATWLERLEATQCP